MICSICGETLDFASNPIGSIVRHSPTDVQHYCKKCIQEIDNKLKNFDLTCLEE